MTEELIVDVPAKVLTDEDGAREFMENECELTVNGNAVTAIRKIISWLKEKAENQELQQ